MKHKRVLLMKAVVFHSVGDIRLDDVKKPTIKDDFDAIIKITVSAICGTDLHFVRGTVGPMEKGTILGHEAVGIVESVGKKVRNFAEGDRVIVPSTVSCGYCPQCRQMHYSQCDVSNPNGRESGTAFFGGPKSSGPLPGCQAEFVRVPFANNNLVKLSDDVSDDKAILLSDIFPTAFFAADIAGVKPGSVVVILGCGPVGLFCIASAKLLGASRIFAIDGIPSRLAAARAQGAECIDFTNEDPFLVIKDITDGSLADIVIDAVGVDAYLPSSGPVAKKFKKDVKDFEQELKKIAPKTKSNGNLWVPGNAPSLALRMAVDLLGKAGTLSIIGVYSEASEMFPIGKAMNKNLRIVMGNCPHRLYIPRLLELVKINGFDPTEILTQQPPLLDVIEAYQQFDLRNPGWIKVALQCEK
jgi:threonine dehydrogenase-like Zn-dependent dehydrogenase